MRAPVFFRAAGRARPARAIGRALGLACLALLFAIIFPVQREGHVALVAEAAADRPDYWYRRKARPRYAPAETPSAEDGVGALLEPKSDRDTPAARIPTRHDRDLRCGRRFRSYDPASGTYLGYDGQRHLCR